MTQNRGKVENKTSKSIFNYGLGILFIIVISIILIVLALFLTQNIPYQEVSLILSVASTTALVVAYILMVFEQRNQTELQEKVIETQKLQTELMEYENRIASVNHSPDVNFRLVGTEGNHLIFQVWNSGEGLALNVGLEINYERIDGDGFTISNDTLFRIIRRRKRATEAEKELLGEDPFENILGEETNPEYIDRTNEYTGKNPNDIHKKVTDNRRLPETRISPINEERKFESNQILRPQDGAELNFRILLPDGLKNYDSRVPFNKALTYIPKNVNRIEVEFVGYFEDAGGSPHRKELFTVKVNPSEGQSLEELTEDKIVPKADHYSFLKDDLDLTW